MARVVLIDPPLLKHPLWDPIRTSQPLGIWSIGSYLQARGHQARLVCAPLQGIEQVSGPAQGDGCGLSELLSRRVELLDRTSSDELVDRWFDDRTLLRVGLSDDEILAEIDAFGPDVVAIASLATCMHQSVVSLARTIRGRYPGLPIVVGGQHATAMPFELLRDAAGAIDLIVAGEGEQVMGHIVDCLPDLAAARRLEGVAYLDEHDELVKNPRPPWANLAELALLDPSLLEHVALPPLPVHTFGNCPKRYTDMMFSVGCHRACPYCYSPVMRGRLRQLSGDRIAA
ncbi:MAG: cobalamin-dependent protein, partial [Candidatus Sericytochromatia bacterium]|nr:cobalamin-dependent protein [Candidatus Tanganyikabacteria bacterium]